MFLIPKYRGIIDPSRPIIVPKMGYSGEARCILYDLNENVRLDTGWGPNLITDNGLDNLRLTSSPFARRYIGSGSTPATVSQTSMQTFLAQSNAAGAGGGVRSGILGGPDYEYWEILSTRFGAGLGTGTVAEIGMGASTDNTGDNIFNRVVLGTPIIKGAENILDVLFKLTIWPPVTTPLAGTSVIEGINYDTITLGSIYESSFNDGSDSYSWITTSSLGPDRWAAYDGDIGSVIQAPAGNTDGLGGNVEFATYTPGNYFVDVTANAGIDGWVLASDIRSIRGSMRHFEFQTQFNEDPGGEPVPKDATEIMDFSWRIGWGRKP
jgi:hypothetical protein